MYYLLIKERRQNIFIFFPLTVSVLLWKKIKYVCSPPISPEWTFLCLDARLTPHFDSVILKVPTIPPLGASTSHDIVEAETLEALITAQECAE